MRNTLKFSTALAYLYEKSQNKQFYPFYINL